MVSEGNRITVGHDGPAAAGCLQPHGTGEQFASLAGHLAPKPRGAMGVLAQYAGDGLFLGVGSQRFEGRNDHVLQAQLLVFPFVAMALETTLLDDRLRAAG